MAKITKEQSEQLTPSSGSWFKLANDRDTARIQFPYTSKDDIGRFSVHKLPIENSNNTYMVDCIRELDDSVEACPLCDAGYSVSPVNVLQFYNHTTGRVEVWERSNKFIERIESLMDTYGEEDFNYRVFQIQRLGAKGDLKTAYEFALLDRADIIDWNDVEINDIVGSTIRDASFEDMDNFIETGSWPQEDSAAPAAPARNARQAVQPRRSAPAARSNPAQRPAAAPPAANKRRAPAAAPAPRAASRTSRVAATEEEKF